MAFPLTLYGDENQLHLSTCGMSFTFGPLLETTRDDVGRLVFAFAPEPGDKVSFTLQRSLLSWPTPFEVNLMTGGPVASWRRHLTFSVPACATVRFSRVGASFGFRSRQPQAVRRLERRIFLPKDAFERSVVQKIGNL